jgi:hypothetical protein
MFPGSHDRIPSFQDADKLVGRRKEEMVADMAPRCAARHNFA